MGRPMEPPQTWAAFEPAELPAGGVAVEPSRSPSLERQAAAEWDCLMLEVPGQRLQR